jgi:hypothetical protein
MDDWIEAQTQRLLQNSEANGEFGCLFCKLGGGQMAVHRSKRKQLKESKQIRSMTRQRKYEMHAAICYKLPVHYRKGIADPKSS